RFSRDWSSDVCSSDLEVYGNAIQIGARLAYELRAFDAQESQVRFLREVLRMVSALQAAYQEAMELGVILLVGAARDSLLPRRFRHSLRHSSGSPPGVSRV